MTSPRNIYPHSYRQEDDCLSYGRSNRLESASYESNRTDLSLNSRDVVVADQWVVLGKIGEGSFGEVFEVRDINTKRHYAIKRENMKIKNPQLKFENIMYDVLAGVVGIPQCHWYGQFDGFDCIVMDLLGPNLSQVRENVSCMELDIAVDLVCQMPDNFLFPSNCYLPEMEMVESTDEHGMPLTTYKKSTCKQVFEEQWGDSYPKLFAVDFGLASYWRDPETGLPYPDTKKHNRSKTGTARYASINVHRGKAHSRRDDVESIGYILLDLLLGTLPWTGVHAKNSKIGWDRMRQLKVDACLADLCAGLPLGVLKFVEYPRSLKFGDQPDYELMRRFLKECLPGGAYSTLVKSPFGGEARPTDNYNVIQQELEELRQKQQKEQQRHYRHRQAIDDNKCNKASDNDDHTSLFAMDDLTNQLSRAAISESAPALARQQRRTSATSQSSLHKLLKRRKAKKVGWNTHKHDDMPWKPKIDWTNDEKFTANLAKSWGEDDPTIMGNGGLPPSVESRNSRSTDDIGNLDFAWSKKHPHFQVKYDKGEDGCQQQQQQTRQRHHSQPHYHRRYSKSTDQPQLQNTNDRQIYHIEGDQSHQRQHRSTRYHNNDKLSHNRRPSRHHNHNINSLQEVTDLDGRQTKNGSATTRQPTNILVQNEN
ncbi:kinase-like domain-containing protein [Absidia repens]|uniref:Kinase-like domain-containing protein n=1 Tax=Absidia repens TaxID=90262 RepID=A0A1X2J0J9_9FUNG|nr:kinase-like domain-containing protein [Absidia repens]